MKTSAISLQSLRFLAAVSLFAAGLSGISANASNEGNALKGRTGQYGSAGCGLGGMVFGRTSGPIQIIAATLNGTFLTQSFGITTGTSNCEPAFADRRASIFIKTNEETLKKEMAQGQGENVRTLSAILGCPDTAALSDKLQAELETILQKSDASNPFESRVLETIYSEEQLRNNCVAFSG